MRSASLLLVALVFAGCGSHGPRTPEQVARAWSAALDRGDDSAAAALFAPGARVVQNGTIVLRGRRDAVAWNEALPCGGKIESVDVQGKTDVLVVFGLTERPGHACDAPGQKAAAVFRIVHGRITLWHQVPPPSSGPSV
jgi:hypothetical protein